MWKRDSWMLSETRWIEHMCILNICATKSPQTLPPPPPSPPLTTSSPMVEELLLWLVRLLDRHWSCLPLQEVTVYTCSHTSSPCFQPSFPHFLCYIFHVIGGPIFAGHTRNFSSSLLYLYAELSLSYCSLVWNTLWQSLVLSDRTSHFLLSLPAFKTV